MKKKLVVLIVFNAILGCHAAQKPAQKSLVIVDEKDVAVGYYTYQNDRPLQEDRAGRGKIKDKKTSEVYDYLAVFDGHCGSHVAEFASNSFPMFFKDATGSVVEKMTTACNKIDQSDFVKKTKGGSTACIAIVSKDSKKIYFGNVGDSRAIVVRSNGDVVWTTVDHRPTRKDERDRIVRNKGFIDSFDGITLRVNGVLAMTRALGDWQLKFADKGQEKKSILICDPECSECSLTSEDEFVVVATDGLWDMMNNEEVAREIVNLYSEMKDLDLLAQYVANVAVQKGSKDNITVLIANLLK